MLYNHIFLISRLSFFQGYTPSPGGNEWPRPSSQVTQSSDADHDKTLTKLTNIPQGSGVKVIELFSLKSPADQLGLHQYELSSPRQTLKEVWDPLSWIQPAQSVHTVI